MRFYPSHTTCKLCETVTNSVVLFASCLPRLGRHDHSVAPPCY